MSLWCLPSSFVSIQLTVWEGMIVIWRNSRWLPHPKAMILAISNRYLTVMPPINRTWFGKRCPLNNFKMATMVVILDIRMKWFQQFWIFVSLWCLSSSFDWIPLTVWEEMSFEEFQDGRHGGHLGYQNGMILAILNLYVTVMPPIKFQLNRTYSLGDVVWRISRWPPWRPSWI